MRAFVFTVEDVFCITGRGCVVVAGMPDHKLFLKPGDGILLKRPDGSEVETTIRGVDAGIRRENGTAIAILLADVTKADIPIGTEVWQA